jgi:hypothetical protein
MIKFVNPTTEQIWALAKLGITGSVKVIVADFQGKSEKEIIDEGRAALGGLFPAYEYAVGWTEAGKAGLLRASKATANHQQIAQGDKVLVVYHRDTWEQPYAEE